MTVEHRFFRYVALVPLVFGVLFFIGADIVEGVTTPREPCEQSLSAGVLPFWGVSNPAILIAWFGAISSFVSLVGAVMWFVSRLRNASDTHARWFFFMFVPLIPLLLCVVTLDSFYGDAVGRWADCLA